MKQLIMYFILCFSQIGVSYCAPVDYEKMSEDIQTMSRLIDGELQKKYTGRYSGGFLNLGCRGIYLKDYGVVFTTQVQFPIFDYQNIKNEKETEPGDLWETYKNRTYTDDRLGLYQPGSEYVSNQIDEIKKLEKFIGDLICNYAGKINQLLPDEYITISVQGSQGSLFSSTSQLKQALQIQSDVFRLKSKEGEKPSVTVTTPSKDLIRQKLSRDSSGQYLIMRIKKKDLDVNCADKIEVDIY